MECQNIINLLENASNQPSEFRTKNWVEINDDSRGFYNTNKQIKFKTSVLKSSLCGYSDTYFLNSHSSQSSKTKQYKQKGNISKMCSIY